jgi:HSP20 family protein
VDVFEKGNNWILKAELPGLDPKQVEVRVEENTLYLKGERKFENEEKKGNYHRVERAYGLFMRSFVLPESVDADKVTAEYKDGLLTITVPKREEAKPKAIKVNVAAA